MISVNLTLLTHRLQPVTPARRRPPTADRSPRGEGHLLRARILEATADLLRTVEDGNAISVRAVADQVGKTVPALYQHFTDKSALLNAAALHALDAMGDAVNAELADVTDLDSRLRRRASGYVEFAQDHPAAYRLLFMTPPPGSSRPTTLETLLATSGFNGMIEDLAAARSAGEMIDEDPREVAIALFTAVHGVASLLIAHTSIEWPDNLLDRVLDQHAFGLLPR